MLLSAYRRDEWSASDLSLLSAHLDACAACRQLEATYRVAGERVRQLPSIRPPEGFRDSVFAAIRAEGYTPSEKVSRASIEAAEADTSPSLPVVRVTPQAAPDELSLRRARKRGMGSTPVRVGAAVVAAAAVLSFAATRVLPGNGPLFSGNATSLGAISRPSSTVPAGVRVNTYAAVPAGGRLTAALVSPQWLVYSETTNGGELVAVNRATHANRMLMVAAGSDAPVLRAVAGSWAVWTMGNTSSASGWTLQAQQLGTIAAPRTLLRAGATDASALQSITGIAAAGTTLVVSGESTHGTGLLLRYDLTSAKPQAEVVRQTSSSGDMLSDPALDGTTIYWAEATRQGGTVTSSIWRATASGTAEQVRSNATHPLVSGVHLLWVTTSGVAGGDVQTTGSALPAVHGKLQALNTQTGSTQTLAPSVKASTVQTSGRFVVWQAADGEHVLDMENGRASSMQPQLQHATFTDANSGALTWGSGTTISVAEAAAVTNS